MKKVFAFAFCYLSMIGATAILSSASTRDFQKAVVVSVEGHQPDTPFHVKPTDAPAPSSESDATVSIRLNCTLYVTRFKSAFAYLPAAFEAGREVAASPGKPFLYVKVPGNDEIKMRIIRQTPVTGDSCKAGN